MLYLPHVFHLNTIDKQSTEDTEILEALALQLH